MGWIETQSKVQKCMWWHIDRDRFPLPPDWIDRMQRLLYFEEGILEEIPARYIWLEQNTTAVDYLKP